MPLVSDYEYDVHEGDPREVLPPAAVAPDGSEVWRAANELENWVIDPDADLRATFVPEPGFRLIESLPQEWRHRMAQFEGVRSTDEMFNTMARIRREDARRNIIDQAGAKGVMAMVGAAMLDPVNLLAMAIPGGAALKGASLGKSVAAGFAAAAGPVALSEAVLQSQQVTRTAEETALNITAGALLGGLFSAAAYGGAKHMAKKRVRMYAGIVDHLGRELDQPVGPSSVGAALREDLMPDYNIARGGNVISRALAKARLSPKAYLESAKNPTVRKFAAMLMESSTYKAHNFADEASVQAIETMRNVQYGRVVSKAKELRHKAYHAKDADGNTLVRQYGDELTVDTELANALRNGDVHPDPRIQSLAKKYRSEVFDPIKTRLQALDLLPEDFNVTGAKSYFPRVYNTIAIEKDPDAFTDAIEAYLRNQTDDPELLAEAKSIAEGIREKILQEHIGRIPYTPIVSKVRERTLQVPDNVLKPWLVDDLDVVVDHYAGTYLPDILIGEQFGSLEDFMSRIDNSYELMITNARGKAKAALRDEKNKSKEYFEFLFDQFKRNHNPAAGRSRGFLYDNAVQPLKDLAFMTYMGRVLAAQLTELGYSAMELPLRKLGRALKDHVLDSDTLKMVNRMHSEDPQALRAMGVGIEDILHNRRFLIGGEDVHTNRGLSKYTGYAADKFATATGMEWFTNNMKWVAGSAVQDKYLDIITRKLAGKPLKMMEAADLRRAGFTDDAIKRIGDQAEHWRYTKGERGAYHPRLENWTDPEVAGIFANAVNRDVNNLIVTPGLGDLPKWAVDSEFGKLFIQFKRFFLAGNNRIVLPMAQRLAKGDVTTMQGMVLASALAMLGIVIRDVSKTGEVNADRTAAQWTKETLDYSGLMGIVMEGFNMPDKLFSGRLSASMGLSESSRYTGQPELLSILGPVAGYVQGGLTAGAGVSDGDVTASDVHKIRKIMPYQNLFYLEQLFTSAEEQVQEAVE